MNSIASILSMAETAAMDGTYQFDWQQPKTGENPYANINLRWTGRNYWLQPETSYERTNHPIEDIRNMFLSELERVMQWSEKINTENDRRKNKKIATKILWEIKNILQNQKYTSYKQEAFGFTVWQNAEGPSYQDRNPEFPELVYDLKAFEKIKKIQDALSVHLSNRDQKFIKSLPNKPLS